MKELQYWADKLSRAKDKMYVILSEPYERKHSNLSFIRIMDSCRVNSRVLKDCKLSSVAWSITSN